MKKLYLLFFVIIAACSSCQKKFLTRDNPTGTTDAKWWDTDAQLLANLSTIYSAIPAGMFDYTPNTFMAFSALTDDAIWNANYFGEINAIAQGNAAPDMPQENWGVITNAIQPLWTWDFGCIRRANRFLKFAGGAYDDPALIKRYMLEARALRAWCFLDLFLYYGDVPLVTTVVSPETPLKRSTTQEIIDFVTSEFDTCAAGLPVSYPATSDKYRMTKGACLTLKAWAFLNAGMYDQAAAAAKQVIDMGVYKLYYNATDSAESYFDLFQYAGSGNQEAILLTPTNHECYGRNAPAGVGGGSNLNPTASLVNAYETMQGKTLAELGTDSTKIYEEYPNYKNNRDPRLEASILYPGETFEGSVLAPFNSDPSNPNRLGAQNSTRTGYWIRKYVDPQDAGHPFGSNLDFMLFRYAGVLLMYVEAQVENGHWNDPLVLKYLNEIRHRAGMPDVNIAEYNSQEKMRELYRRERRIELAFEGSRLFDMRRWKIGDQVMNGEVKGATDPATGQTIVVGSRHFNPARDYVWPIPIGEMQGNPDMVQNPGY